MNAIEMTAVTRLFRGGTAALDGVTFAVPDGSICGLLGRNGAGKTTLMSLVAGQDRATSGDVRVFGKQPFENESVLSHINFVRDNQRYPDGYRLHHVLRIAPDFAPDWSTEVADEVVDGFRIPVKTPIKKMSRGQLSSVAIMIGLASRARLTLFDEPYLGLDTTGRALFHDVLVRDLTAHPRTVILSTHLVEESEALFDRALILDRGRIRAHTAIERIGELAHIVTGATDVVDRICAGKVVLTRHTVAGLSSATLDGAPSGEITEAASQTGARVTPATLTELVSAFGADRAEAAPSKDRKPREGSLA